MRVKDMRQLIKETLQPVGLYSENAEELLILTCAAESLGGYYLYQQQGPARGFFQMEPATEKDILINYVRYKQPLRAALGEYIYFNNGGDVEYKVKNPLVTSLAYQILMARIHYLRKPGAIPEKEDITGLAEYWKTHYNTHLGKGTVQGAIKKYKDYVK